MLATWIRQAREAGASDLLLEAGTPAVIRVRGELAPLGSETISGTALQDALSTVLDEERRAIFRERGSLDFSRTEAGVRCRFNIFRTSRGWSAVIRLLSSFQSTITDSNLHPSLAPLVHKRNGLILVCGPTGSGKSTTLAALVEEINRTSSRHVITLESPIEYYFANRKSFIRQREIPTHSPSFEQAIMDSLRETPDVLVIGEMRTPEVIRQTLTAAETGHLVLATIHSSNCAEALTRICMSFSPEIQLSVRVQLADALTAVVSQRLMYLPKLGIRVPHCEILQASTAVRALIRSGQWSQISSAIQTGGEDGSWSWERYEKWIQSQRTWVLPSQAQPLPAREEREVTSPSRFIPKAQAPSVRAEAGTKSDHDPSRIEIDPADEDLESLAKRILGDG